VSSIFVVVHNARHLTTADCADEYLVLQIHGAGDRTTDRARSALIISLRGILEYRSTVATSMNRGICTGMKIRGLSRGHRDWGDTIMVRILLADHHAVVRRGLCVLFEACQGFEVCGEASDGREAVELALQHKPDVAILDISLPVVNGIEATRKIRKVSPGTEVLIFTLCHRESEVRDVLHAGARGYLIQPEADYQIVRAVEALAQHRAFFSDHVSEILLSSFFERARSGHNTLPLTVRERKVVQLIAEGTSNKRTAHLLSISVKTVETHRTASMRKLDIHSTADLVRYAFREGLVQP
jgi:DNA-binding NarL/FixJ family response regulator